MADMSERTGSELSSLAERVAALEGELAALRADLRDRVETHRVVIVDDQGNERVALDARHDTGSVLVRIPGTDGQTTGIELYATELEADPAEFGWCLLRDGDVISRWTAS